MKIRLTFLSALLVGFAGCSDDSPAPKPTPDNNNNVTNNADEDMSDDAQTPDPVFEGVVRCEEAADCDDGLSCTTDACVEQAGQGKICAWSVVEDTCLIQGVCHEPGDTDSKGCGICDPATPDAWSGVADGEPCDDGNICTFDTTCQAGICTGEEVDCDDGNSCTVASCDPIAGCMNTPAADGTACDDASLCTTDDMCVGGTCVGGEVGCDDGNPCTDDVCDPETGCTHTNNTAGCDDGDPCTTGDTCSEGVCGAGEPETCDDNNACTIDVCHPVAGCQYLPTNSPCCTGEVSICDDGNPCTTDLCDPDTAGCTYEFNTLSCNDGNACTENDTCFEGSCGGTTRTCDDGNDCTSDSCNVNQGCIHSPLTGNTCDDGLSCSTGDVCAVGVCSADTSQCFCTPSFADASKFSSLALGANTSVGEALDVDGDGDRDNVLSALGGFVNQPLADAVADGSLILLFEYIGFQPGQFTLALLTGELDPTNPTCDLVAATCDYYASRASLNNLTCDRLVQLPATRTGNLVTAGGPTTQVPVSIPLDAANTLDVTVYMARIEKTVTVAGTNVSAFNGILGGAVTETDLNAAINSLDPDSLPLPPAQLINLLGTLAPNDIDTDGNGTLDAKSIALKITGIDGNLTGAQ